MDNPNGAPSGHKQPDQLGMESKHTNQNQTPANINKTPANSVPPPEDTPEARKLAAFRVIAPYLCSGPFSGPFGPPRVYLGVPRCAGPPYTRPTTFNPMLANREPPYSLPPPPNTSLWHQGVLNTQPSPWMSNGYAPNINNGLSNGYPMPMTQIIPPTHTQYIPPPQNIPLNAGFGMPHPSAHLVLAHHPAFPTQANQAPQGNRMSQPGKNHSHEGMKPTPAGVVPDCCFNEMKDLVESCAQASMQTVQDLLLGDIAAFAALYPEIHVEWHKEIAMEAIRTIAEEFKSTYERVLERVLAEN